MCYLPWIYYTIETSEVVLKTGQTVADSSFQVVLKNIENLANP